MAPFVCAPVEAEGLFAIGPIGDDGCRAARIEPITKLGAVVSLVPEQLLCRPGAADQPLRRWTIVCIAATQQDG
jgi:hypothetical protein